MFSPVFSIFLHTAIVKLASAARSSYLINCMNSRQSYTWLIIIFFVWVTYISAFLGSSKYDRYCKIQSKRICPLSLLSSSSSSNLADEIPSLYKEQERLLVKRGIVEADLMRGTGSPIQPSVSKGTGAAKGFGGPSAGSSGKIGSSKAADLKAAAKVHAKELQKSGVVRIDNVLTDNMVDELREYIFNLRRQAEERVNIQEAKPIAYFADVLLKENRCDLTIPLEDDLVIDAVLAVLQKSPVGRVVSSIMGQDAMLYELSCLISDPGSRRQVTHPDTPYSSDDDPVLYTCFIALQDIDLNMGPTTWIPNTHTAKAHELFQNDSVEAPTGESPKDRLLRTMPSVLGVLPKGSCAIFDSRVLHCGGANTSEKSRAIFYCTFKNPRIGYPGNPGSIRRDLISKYTINSLEKELAQRQKQR